MPDSSFKGSAIGLFFVYPLCLYCFAVSAPFFYY